MTVMLYLFRKCHGIRERLWNGFGLQDKSKAYLVFQYFQTKFLETRPFSVILKNFLVAHAKDGANNAIMCYHRHHPFLNFTLNELVSHFNSKIWGHQGPQRVSASAKQYCDLESGILEGINCTPKDEGSEKIGTIGSDKMGRFSILHHSTGKRLPLLSCLAKAFGLIKFFLCCFCNLVPARLVHTEINVYLMEDREYNDFSTTYSMGELGKILQER